MISSERYSVGSEDGRSISFQKEEGAFVGLDVTIKFKYVMNTYMHLGYGPLRSVFFFCRDKMFWTTAVLWKIIKVLRYLSEMIRYFLARKKELFFCSILDRSTRLSPHLLQQHGKIRHESEGASVFDGAFRHRGDAQRLYPSWFGGCGG